MESKDNKILIIYKNCDKVIEEIKSNLTDNAFDMTRRIVFKIYEQNDCEIVAINEELIEFESIVLIGFSAESVQEFDRRIRTIAAIDGLKLIFADIRQTFVYLFTDFGPNFRHKTFEEYLQTFGDNISDEVNRNGNELQAYSLLESIICGCICGQFMASSLQSKQLFCYKIDSQIISYKFETDRPIVVIGLGSLGFSAVKKLVSIGAKRMILIDSDSVHKYNLRHNLFNESDVGLNKCDVIKRFVHKCSEDIKTETFCRRIQQANNQFFEAISSDNGVIVSAVDNIETKRFLNKVCLNHCLPLIDIGIDGHMFHIQAIVPHLTESYFAFSDPSDPEYPLCVIKSFPTSIEHCVQWSKMKSDSWLNSRPKRSDNWVNCLHISRLLFENCFNRKAKQLLFSIPLDQKDENGSDFWADKRTPHPIVFDLNNVLHKTYVISFAQLIASINSIEIPIDSDISEIISSLTVPEFTPKRDKTIITDPMISQNMWRSAQSGDQQNDNLKRQTISRDNENLLEFIFASSNLRADMYGIEKVSISEINRIYHKIIYCFASTLSTASAVASIELIKLLQLEAKYKSSEKCFKNANHFLNLSDLDASVVTRPAQPLKTKLSNSYEYTEWDQWLISETEDMSTLEDVLNELQNRSGSLCTMMVMEDSKSIYLPQLFAHHLKRKKQSMRDIISDYYQSIPPFVMLTVLFESDSGSEDISGPNVKYVFLK